MIFPIRGCLVSEDSTGESRGARRSHEGHLFGKTPGDWICGDCNDLAIIFPMENPRKGESVILFFGGCLSKSQDMKTGGRWWNSAILNLVEFTSVRLLKANFEGIILFGWLKDVKISELGGGWRSIWHVFCTWTPGVWIYMCPGPSSLRVTTYDDLNQPNNCRHVWKCGCAKQNGGYP